MKTKLFGIGLMLLLAGCGLNTKRGNGQKIGQVVKLTRQGVMRDTWEAQLIRGGMSGGSGSFGTVPFDFTIENDATVKQVEEFMNKQTEVVITYRVEGVYSLFRSDSRGAFLESIRPATTNK